MVVAAVLAALPGGCGGGDDGGDDGPDAAGGDDGGAPALELGGTAIDFGAVDIGATGSVALVVTNTGAAAAPIDAVTVGGVFGAAHDCPASLGAGASCTITLEFAPIALGPAEETLVVASGADQVTAVLAGRGAFTLTIDRHGDGEVVSDPPGIQCGSTCSARFTESVTLTAVTGPGGAVYWGPTCGDAPTCEVAGPGPTELEVFLALGALLHVEPVGALLQVAVVADDVVIDVCHEACLLDVPTGSEVVIAASSPGEAAVISGPCAATHTCSFAMPTGSATVDVVAPVAAATGEQWRVRFDAPVLDAAFDGAGDLVVLAGGALVKLDAAGVELWSVPSTATALEVGPDDTIYLVAGDIVRRLTAAGVVMWSATGAGGCAGPLSQCLAVGPSGEVATAFAGVVRRFAADGTPSWTRTLGTVEKSAVAIDAAGVVYATSDAVDQLDLERTSATGTAMPALETFCDHYYGGPVIDPATGAPWCVSSGSSEVVWRLDASTAVERATDAVGEVETGLATTGTGDVGWAYENSDGDETAWTLERLTGTTPAWQHVFPVRSFADAFTTYSNPSAITGSTTGRLAVAGGIVGFLDASGFVISVAP